MKRILLAAAPALALLTAAFVYHPAAAQPYRVAFDLTSRDTMEQKAVLRWLNEVGSANPQAQMEVVMYGKGFELVMPERSQFVEQVKDAMKNPNVKFKVCRVALRSNNVDPSQLIPGTETVPDGIHELVMKQQEHWGYIKVMH